MSNRDDDFFKRAYKDTWDESTKREDMFKQLLEQATGCKLIDNGLGARSTSFISGSAKANGKEKGAPDFRVSGTRIYIEVTGPLKANLSRDAPLWFRPDKIEHAIKATTEDDFLVHHCPSVNEWRFVHVNYSFAMAYEKKKFKTVTPSIRGVRERYVEIPASDDCVRPIEELFKHVSTAADKKAKPLNKKEPSPDALAIYKEQRSETYPHWHVLDVFLTEVKHLERKVYESYIGYRLPGESAMLVTISPKQNPVRIRVSSSAAKLKVANELRNENHDTPQDKFDISLNPNSRLGEIINVLEQLNSKRS